MCPRKLNHLVFQQMKLQALPKHIDYVNIFALDQGRDADGQVVERIVLGRGIPGLDNLAIAKVNAACLVIAKPLALDDIADGGNRRLLELAGKHDRIVGLAP